MNSVSLITGARLHFGLLVQGPPSQWTYGGLGMMIDQPGFALRVRFSETNVFHATPPTAARLEQMTARCLPPGAKVPVEITLTSEIPAHAGLGSGTQLGLALAAALSRLHGEPPPPVSELANRSGRAERSAIGTVGFEAGGLIAQGSRADDGTLRPVVTRCDFPPDWRFVLVRPREHQGLFGESERNAFREMPPMPDAQLRHLLGLQSELMTAAATCRFEAFSRDLYEFGQQVGGYFSQVQGGVFASPLMEQLAQRLRAAGITGVGQTSWGPTLFALCESQQSAESVAEMVRDSIDLRDCEVRIVRAMNRGRNIE